MSCPYWLRTELTTNLLVDDGVDGGGDGVADGVAPDQGGTPRADHAVRRQGDGGSDAEPAQGAVRAQAREATLRSLFGGGAAVG